MATESFVLRIRDWPNPLQAQELLEVVLAGASLELELDVLFEDQAVAFLDEDAAVQWQQLLDHNLARVWFCGDRNEFSSQQVSARPIGRADRNRLLSERTLIEL